MPVEYIEKSKNIRMKYFKKFFDFISEGAREEDGKIIISTMSHEDDMLKNSNKSKSLPYRDVRGEEAGGRNLPIRVYWGLVSNDEQHDTINFPVKDMMDRIKKNDFISNQGLIDFIRKTSINPKTDRTEFEGIKYVAYAESANGTLLPEMAETISNKFGAKVFHLKKKIYTKETIMRPQYKITSEDFNLPKTELIDRLTEIIKEVKPTFSESGKSGLSSQQTLIKLFDAIEKQGKDFKLTTDFNHIRHFINTKYFIDPEIDKAIKSCLFGPSRMMIIDDNLHTGTDFKEFATYCNGIIEENEELPIGERKELKTAPGAKSGAFNRIQNVFGYVLYKIYEKNGD
jgi:hypothetical protein